MEQKENKSKGVALSARKAAKERALDALTKEQEAKDRYKRVQEEHIQRRDQMRKMLLDKSERTNAILRNKSEYI